MINTNDIRNNKYRRLAVRKAARAGKERQRERGRDASSVYCVTIMKGPLVKLYFREKYQNENPFCCKRQVSHLMSSGDIFM